MKRDKKIDKSILLLLLIIIVALVTAGYLYIKMRTDSIKEAIKKGETINILFLVNDKERLLFSEVLFHNPITRKGAVLDIPGETGDIIKSLKRIDRIDILYKPENPQLFKNKIEQILNQEIPYYIQISIENVEKLVDIVEGLEMFIANPVEISTDDELVLLPSGSVVLDGSKIRSFLTYTEEGETEIERIGRKQKYIQALLQRIGENYTVLENVDVYPYFKSMIDTNLGKYALFTMMEELNNLDIERLVFQRVLGVKREVDNQILLFRHYDGALLKETVKQTLESIANSDVISDEDLNITIEILNGTKMNGLASRTSQVFQSFGYDVASVDNADNENYEKTIILNRRGDLTQAQKVAAIIKCKHIETVKNLDPDIEVLSDSIDITIILGKDFDGRYCKD